MVNPVVGVLEGNPADNLVQDHFQLGPHTGSGDTKLSFERTSHLLNGRKIKRVGRQKYHLYSVFVWRAVCAGYLGGNKQTVEPQYVSAPQNGGQAAGHVEGRGV